MKIIELLIDELDKLSGVDAVALVEEPAIEADFFAFKEADIDDTILFNLIQNEVLELFDETEDVYELKIGDYQTRHYDMCPAASNLYKQIESGDIDVDMGLAIRAARLQDSLFWLEKHTIDQMGSASFEDVVSAQNIVSEIMELARMMGLEEEHQYVYSHLQAIRDLYEGKEELDVDVAGLPNYVNEIKEEFESYTDYPESSTNAAKRALKWREEHPDNDCGTRVGWARANQLADRRPISEETIARMASFARHLQYEDVPYSEGCGGLMVDAWGGRAGIEWAKNKLESIREENSAETQAFSRKTAKFTFAMDEDQQIVVGPLMIPEKLILRVDEENDPYYVFFSEETVKKIAYKLMKEKNLDALNIEHNPEDLVEGHMLETWLVEDPAKDKQQVYGFNFPKGTWMGQYKVEDLSTWKKIKAGDIKGFSVEGFFQDKFIQASKNI